MRENFTLSPDEMINEAKSIRTYVHETGRASDFHGKGVKLLQSFIAGVTKPGQQILSLFREYKKAMTQAQHLGQSKTGNSDVVETLRNILREIYGNRRFDAIDVKMGEIEQNLKDLEQIVSELANEDVSQSISDLSKSQRQLKRERPTGVVDAGAKLRQPRNKPDARVPDPTEDEKHAAWEKTLPVEGTPEWDRWVAMRAHHIQSQKQKAHNRGDTNKGDDLHGHDWWDHKAHWQQAADEIRRYIASGKDNKKFAWSKHYNDWRAEIGQALNEYYEIKAEQDKAFFRSIMPPRPKTGYM